MCDRAEAAESAVGTDAADCEVRQRYRALVDVVDAGVYRLDSDGRFVSIDEQLLEMTGYAREDLLEEHVTTVLDDADQRRLERALADRSATDADRTDALDATVRTADGERMRCELRVRPLVDDDEFRGAIGSVRDVTAREERERELERKERRYEAIFEDPNILVGLLEPDGTVLDINGTAMEYVDADLEAVTGEPFWETPWWGEGDEVRSDVERWTERAAAGEYVDFEADLTRPNGEQYTLRGYFRPVTDDDGEVVSIIVSDRDVTERRERERELRRYERILETIDDGVYVLDGDSRFHTMNEAFADMLGRDREALIGEHASAVFPEEKVERAERYQREMIEGETDIGELEEFVKAADGEVPVVTRFALFETGDGVGRVGVVRDVTERNERERELERNKEQLETLFEVLPVGVVVAEADGEIVAANDTAHAIWGGDVFDAASVEEYERYALRWADSGERVDPEEMTLARVLRGEEVREPDVVEIDAVDGERRIVELEGIPIRNEAGEVIRGVVTMSDVTERRETQRRLAESERRYRTLVENFPNGAVGLFDEDLRYTAAGGEMLDDVGTSAADIVGKTLWERYPEELVARLEPKFRAALEGETNAFEIEMHDRHWLAYTLPVEDDDGDTVAGMMMVQDVSERKAMERRLRESEAKFRTVAENVDEIVWMTTPDADEFLYVNPTYEDVWNRDRSELYEDSYAFAESIHPDDRERVLEAWRDLPDEAYEEEYRIVRPDGEVRWIHAQTTRVHDERGDVTRIVGIANDVTDRKKRERALEKSERRYRTLAEHFPNGAVGVYDEDLRYTLAAGSELGEMLPAADRLEGSRMPAIFPDDAVAELRPLFRAAVEDGETGTATVEFNGRTWRVWTTPLRDDHGDIFAGLSFTQDITERVEREQRLEELIDELAESNERLEQFAYAASHDLQEPLRMVSSYVKLLEQRYADELDDDAEEFIAYAVDGAERMHEMINALLEYSRVETQGDPLEPTDLDEVVDDVLADLQFRIEETDAEIEREPLPVVAGDANQLRQVFQNLLKNALKYSGDDPPRVSISAERRETRRATDAEGDGSTWRISVSDEGIGIDPEDQDRIFDVFQRLHTREEHAGTGIGLALTERIVERHGGDIWVDSEPGEQTTFTFTLPDASGHDE